MDQSWSGDRTFSISSKLNECSQWRADVSSVFFGRSQNDIVKVFNKVDRMMHAIISNSLSNLYVTCIIIYFPPNPFFNICFIST